MIVHEFLEKHSIVIVEIGDSAGAPLHVLMPNGHPELDRDSFFLEQMFAIDALEPIQVEPIQIWARQIAFYGKRLMSIDTDVIHDRESEMNRDMTKRTLHYQFCASVVRCTYFPTHGQDVTCNMEFELTADSVGQMQLEVTGSVFPYSLDLTAAVSKYL